MRVLVNIGFRRATVELTARQAGVSHMTVYRRWPSKAELFRSAVLREFTAIFDAAFSAAAQQQTFDTAVETAFTDIVWAVHSHPLIARELSIEPEFVLPFLTTDSGPAMQSAISVVADRLQRLAEGTDRLLVDPDALADIFVRLAHALVLAPDPVRPLASRVDVEVYARRHLLPLTQSATTAVHEAAGGSRASPHDSALLGASAAGRRPAGRRSSPRLAAMLVAILLGSAVAAATMVQSKPAAVTPSNTNGSEPAPRPADSQLATPAPPPQPAASADPPPIGSVSTPTTLAPVSTPEVEVVKTTEVPAPSPTSRTNANRPGPPLPPPFGVAPRPPAGLQPAPPPPPHGSAGPGTGPITGAGPRPGGHPPGP